jgi:hydroxymethylbilane synthase
MLRIATRRSPLAKWQAEWVADRLRSYGHSVDLVLLTSEGDVNNLPIDGSQMVGLFTKGIQRAVLEGQAEIAVHSLKDLPTQIDTGLELAAVPPRAEVADCLVSLDQIEFDQLPQGAKIGTGSRRRAAQLLARRPDLRVESIRGNVQTRLEKMRTESFDAIVLAQAGLLRLGMESLATRPLPRQWMLPAPGQGALGIEVRQGDTKTSQALAPIDCQSDHASVAAERQVLRRLQAGCLAPVAALAQVSGTLLMLEAVVLSVDGAQKMSASVQVDWDEESPVPCGEAAGDLAAEQLLSQGAAALIAAAR